MLLTDAKDWTNLLVCHLIRRVVHQLLDLLDASNLSVNVHQHLGTLLQARQDILLDLCDLDVRGELLNLQELAIGLRLQRLLVLAFAKRKFGTSLVAIGQCAARGFGLLVHEDIDSLLVLEEAVSLDLEVEDRPARAPWLAIAMADDADGSYLSCSVTLPLLCLPPIFESFVCLSHSKSRFWLFQDSRLVLKTEDGVRVKEAGLAGAPPCQYSSSAETGATQR
jgi:hypothetical protein